MADRRAVIAAGLMLSMSAAAAFRMPTRKLSDSLPPLRLADAVPARPGDWRLDGSLAPLVASADIEEQAGRIYSQTLARTFTDGSGAQVMLMIAYGEDQADATTQLHLPELCYASQGFEVARRGRGLLALPQGALPVVRLFARESNRPEPITYWTTVGDRALNSETERKLARARYALRGEIPDGMLVRVSSIDDSEPRAFRNHDRFIAAWASDVSPGLRSRFFGVAG